jgi:DNA-binding NtrC family response regulator
LKDRNPAPPTNIMTGLQATPQPDQILIVDDTPANLDVLCQLLEAEGYRVLAVPNGEVALRLAGEVRPELILLDVMMPEMDGFETCRQLKTSPATSDVPVIFISARDEVGSLLQGFKAGGVDYISKPFRAEEVIIRVETHLKINRLNRQLTEKNEQLSRRSVELTAAIDALQSEMHRREKAEDALRVVDGQLSVLSDREAERWGVAGFVGESKTLIKILQGIRRVQNFGSVNVLITGESGTGKELVARAIHFGSNRARQPFIPVNCVAIPEELAESMLFGHVRGAFTGATMDRKGYFELADGGTLFLDEIGDMPASLQAKLLRVLEDGRVTPLGSTRERKVDVRIVAATNANLPAQIAAGGFRQDLYFRLAQYEVELPPLRERRSDVPILAAHFIRLFAKEMGAAEPAITSDAVEALSAYDYPGNVRELKNIIERSLIESDGDPIAARHLRLPHKTATGSRKKEPVAAIESGGEPTGDLPLNLEEAEAILIRRALAETGGNIAEAARRMGINRTRIYRKLSEINGPTLKGQPEG